MRKHTRNGLDVLTTPHPVFTTEEKAGESANPLMANAGPEDQQKALVGRADDDRNGLDNDDEEASVIPVYLFEAPTTPELPDPESLSFKDAVAEGPSGARNPKQKPPKAKGARRRTLRLSQKQKDSVKRHAKQASKKLVMFLISQVGLTCMVVGYSIMGGFIFEHLEKESEEENVVVIKEIRERHVKQLWNVTNVLNVLHEEDWQRHADNQLQLFQQEVYCAVKDYGWDGTDKVTTQFKWTYAGALLYSVTVITTIGYGNLTPKTVEGRVVTMLYAIVGIPMTLMCLANIGSLMAHCFRLLWAQIVCKPCRDHLKRRATLQAAKKKATAAAYFAQVSKQQRQTGASSSAVVAAGDGLAPEAQGEDAAVLRGSETLDHDGTALLAMTLRMSRLGRSQGDVEQGRCSTGFDGLTSAAPSPLQDSSACNLDSTKTHKNDIPSDSTSTLHGYGCPAEANTGDAVNRDQEGPKSDQLEYAIRLEQSPLPSPSGLETQKKNSAYNVIQLGTNEIGPKLSADKLNVHASDATAGPSRKSSVALHEEEKSPASSALFQYPETPQAGSICPEIAITDEDRPSNTLLPPSTPRTRPKKRLPKEKTPSPKPDWKHMGDMLAACQEVFQDPSRQEKSVAGPSEPSAEEVSKKKTKKQKKEHTDQVRVPIMVCLVMVMAYIVLGAICFSIWENWGYFESSYFCFVTLSTIGFGDLVPGYEHDAWDNTAKRVTCTLYLLFGLALLAMCFELIQAEFKQKFLTLARSLGFNVDEE